MVDARAVVEVVHGARIITGETRLETAALDVIHTLVRLAVRQVRQSGLDPSILDARQPSWAKAVDEKLLPVIEDVYTAAFTSDYRPPAVTAAAAVGEAPELAASPYASAYLAAVRNRLVGVPETVFDMIRASLDEGRREGEDMRQLAARVDALLGDAARWKSRARTIARTEVIAANNAGLHAAGGATAQVLGVNPAAVAREWFATGGPRTRESHAAASGQTVMGLDTPFTVGDALLLYPGDPSGPADEVVNCRCTSLTHYPGDPAYPGDTMTTTNSLTAAAPEGDGIPALDGEDSRSEDEECTCCGGSGEHTCGHECYVCDAAGTREAQAEADAGVAPGDPLVCEGHHGRPDPCDDGREGTECEHDPDEVSPDAAPEGTPTAPDDEDDPMPTDQQAASMTVNTKAVTAAAGDPVPTIQPPVEMDAGEKLPDVANDGLGGDLGDKFHGVCTIEGIQTGDTRGFAAGSLEWDDWLPLAAGWQPADLMGHEGAIIFGRIDSFRRSPTDAALIEYEGTYDLMGAGWEVQRLVDGKFLRGVSVDVDDCEVQFVTPEGEVVAGMDMMFGGDDLLMVVTRGRIRSFTACRIPAFSGAWIANGPLPPGGAVPPGTVSDEAPADEDTPADELPVEDVMPEEEAAALVASGAAKGRPVADRRPAPSAYANPGFALTDGRLVEHPSYPGKYGCPLTVTDDRRVYGHAAVWGVCHVAYTDRCVTPPMSATGYAYYLGGVKHLSDDSVVPVGQITMGTGHADPRLGLRAAASHYDNTGSAVADVCMGEDEFGIWFAGTLRPDVTADEVDILRATGQVSGDWREQPLGSNQYEFIAGLVVNVPGFPIPRIAAGLQNDHQMSLVAAGSVPARSVSGPVMGGADLDTVTGAVLQRLRRSDHLARLAASVGVDPASRIAAAVRATKTGD